MEALIVVLWIIWPIMAGSIASSKDRNPVGWGILGAFIGFIAVIWVACLPALEE